MLPWSEVPIAAGEWGGEAALPKLTDRARGGGVRPREDQAAAGRGAIFVAHHPPSLG